VRGYLVRPAKASGKVASVGVVLENRGLNPYLEDVARHVAEAGFVRRGYLLCFAPSWADVLAKVRLARPNIWGAQT